MPYWSIWTWVHIINFRYVPPELRISLIAFVSIIWLTIFSRLANHLADDSTHEVQMEVTSSKEATSQSEVQMHLATAAATTATPAPAVAGQPVPLGLSLPAATECFDARDTVASALPSPA